MNHLDYEKLNRIDYRNFRRRKPFPWSNPSGVLREDAFHRLIENLPDVSLFERRQGYTRDYGQKGHDRYSLEYRENLDIDACWHEFVEELQQSNYRRFLHRLYGVRPMKLAFHWHYTKNGNTVSPHCDSKRKIGSHIFYLNTDEDWKAEWGGQTLILNDHGRFNCKSAPDFSDFDEQLAADSIGNKSLIFRRTPHSWHGVDAINCPDNTLRKVFIVVIERVRPIRAIRCYFREHCKPIHNRL